MAQNEAHTFLLACTHHSDFLLDGLTILKNRGYDSAGLATMNEEGGPLVGSIGDTF